MGLLIGLTACNDQLAGTDAEDETNPYFKQAAQYESEQNFHGALKEYENALHANPAVARTHLLMGLIYSEKLGDPISGIYHFQAYLKDRPDAPDKNQVQTYIDKAKIDFALSLPNSPVQNAEEFARLSKENAELKQTIAQLQATPAPKADAKVETKTEVKTEAKPTEPVATSNKASATPAAATSKPTSPTVTTNNPSTPVAATVQTATPAATTSNAKTHVIGKGDSLWKIAKKYYPEDVAEGVKKIKEANPELTANERNLKLGTKLVVP